MKTKTIKVPQSLYRSASVRVMGEGEEKSFSMSISSDVPYLRYDYWNDEEYYEVLNHGPDGMDDTRLKAGLPILFNHGRDNHLARATSFTNDGHKCEVSGLIWSESDFAKVKRADALSGALPDTSVGYAITDDGECIGAKDGIPIYQFKWQPYEASLVTIPADISVGVGRQRDHKPEGEPKEITVKLEKGIDTEEETDNQSQSSTENMKFKTRSAFYEADKATGGAVVDAPKIDLVKERETAVADFRGRVNKINDWVKNVTNPAWKEKAAEVAAKHTNGEADFDSFRTEALNSFQGVTQVAGDVTGEIGMSKKELKNYSLSKAILARGLGKPLDGLEKEASDAQAKLLRKEADGFYIPEDWSARSLEEIHGMGASQRQNTDLMIRQMHRALAVGNFASAGALVGTDLLGGSLIELLRNKAVILSLGPTMLGGLVGNIAIPKQVGGATAYWLPEGGTVTATDQTFAQLGLVPHRLAAQTAYDKQLLAQSSVSVEALVRNDIALVMAIKKDLAAISGSGVAGEPLGIKNTTGVGTVTFGATATWAKALEFETDLATANADQTGTPVFLTNPSVRGKWKALPKVAASTMPVFIWGDMVGNNVVNGYQAYVTNQIGTDNLVYFFVPSELIVADWAGIDVVVNPFSLDSTGQIRVTITQWTDIGVRHPGAFIISTDSGAQ